MLKINNLQVFIKDKEIVKNVSLTINPGEIHALMGPNGSGKSSLAYALAGHPDYKIKNSKSKINLDGKNIITMSPDQRARVGLFLAFQYPLVIEGVSIESFLRQAYGQIYPKNKLPIFKFRALLYKNADLLGVKKELLNRYLNDGFSGGEKKRVEILQLLTLKPKYAICDETDSGLDIDALKIVAKGIQTAVVKNKMGCLVITHYQRILRFLRPQKVHVMVRGKIVQSGGKELARQLEKKGYKDFFEI